MTDDWAEGGADFDESFFASLEASPDEPIPEDAADDDTLDFDLEGDGGVEEFLYETEEDGSFETDAADDLENDGAFYEFDGESTTTD